MDHTHGRENAALCDLLGALKMEEDRKQVSELDVVALLADLPTANLARGQVGTVVELLDEANVLVEFSGDDGRPYAIAPCSPEKLLVLHYVPEAIA